MLSEHSRQGAPLDRAIAGLPVKREYFSEGHSRILLDLTIQLNEGDLRLKRQFGSQRGLAGSAQPNQGDTLPASPRWDPNWRLRRRSPSLSWMVRSKKIRECPSEKYSRFTGNPAIERSSGAP